MNSIPVQHRIARDDGIKMLLKIIAALLLVLGIGVTANTEIINAGPIYCSVPDTTNTILRSLHVSQSWPILHLDDSSAPALFSIVPDLEQRARVDLDAHGHTSTVIVPRADEGYWIALRFNSNSEHPAEPSLLQRLAGLVTKRFTIRVSWPANHPLDLHMTLHTPESMLRVGGRKVEEEVHEMSQQAETESAERTKLCPVLYLHLYATSHGVRIPPAKQGSHDSAVSKWLLGAAETYMSPLYTEAQVKDDGGDQEQGPTPIHVVLEPLVLGSIPRGVLVSAVTLGGYVSVVWVTFIWLGLMPKSPFQAT